MYQGIVQLRSGLSRPLAITGSYRHASYHPYRRGNQLVNNGTMSRQPSRRQTPEWHDPIDVSSPSKSKGPTLRRFSEREMDTLEDLKMGLGVSKDNIDDLFEQCDHCGQSFMRSALRVHIKQVGEDNSDEGVGNL